MGQLAGEGRPGRSPGQGHRKPTAPLGAGQKPSREPSSPRTKVRTQPAGGKAHRTGARGDSQPLTLHGCLRQQPVVCS